MIFKNGIELIPTGGIKGNNTILFTFFLGGQKEILIEFNVSVKNSSFIKRVNSVSQ